MRSATVRRDKHEESAVAKIRSRRVDKTGAGPRDPATRLPLQQPYVLLLHVTRVYWLRLRPWPLVGSPKSQQLSTTTRNLRPRHGNHLAKLSRHFFLACEDRFPPGPVAQERKFTGLLRTEGAELHGSVGARTRGCSAPEAFTGWFTYRPAEWTLKTRKDTWNQADKLDSGSSLRSEQCKSFE